MASVVTYNGGLRRIDFALTPNGQRLTVRLGRVSVKLADGINARVEAIIADKLANRPHDAELSKWLGGLDEKMLARMRAVGLADGVGLSQTTLAGFLSHYFADLVGKPATKIAYGHCRRNLETFFDASRLMRDISPADADGWRAWLVGQEKLSSATVARRVEAARMMWRRAIRWRLASENPFAGIKAGHQSNDKRKVFVPQAVIAKVIAEAPDAEWRAIIALSRYGGLRCPSEHFALKWGDIDWEKGTIHVTCPKLEHLAQFSHRTVPLFAELRGYLLALFDEAPEGSEHVIVKNRLSSCNLRSRFQRMLGRAGVDAWPKLFHNLRASRETELMREYDLATVCKWLGNSPAIAARHYATSVDLNSDFRRAAGLDEAQQKAQQNAQQSASASGKQAMTAEQQGAAKPLENKANVAHRQQPATAGKPTGWAVSDSNG